MIFSVGYELILCLFCMLCFNSVGYILIMQAIFMSVELCFCIYSVCSVFILYVRYLLCSL